MLVQGHLKVVMGRRVQCQDVSYLSWCKATQGGNG